MPYPMEPVVPNGGQPVDKSAETYEPKRGEIEAAKEALARRDLYDAVAGAITTWDTPVIFEHSKGKDFTDKTLEEKVDEAAHALSPEHQDELRAFESAMTKELAAKGIPFVFIQPGDPGHKEAVAEAKKHLVQDFTADEPIRPCDHESIVSGCRACSFKVGQAKRRLVRWDP